MITERMGGRRVCSQCGATCHIVYNPPKKAGVCDNCGGELIQRADDNPETVLERLRTYHEMTQPLIDFYQKEGVLKSVDGTQSQADVFTCILGALK